MLCAVLTVVVVAPGCAGTVSLPAAEAANDPACAELMVRLPDQLAGQDRRWTDAQATAAWGDPAAVLFTCGLPASGPSELPCQTVGNVDWLIDEAEAPRYRVTTYGREPAVQLFLDNEIVSSAEVLTSISNVIDLLPRDGSACLDRPSD